MKNGESNGLFNLCEIDCLKESTPLSGKLLSSIVNTCNKSENKEKVETIAKEIQQTINKFKEEEFTCLRNKINKILSSIKTTSWSK